MTFDQAEYFYKSVLKSPKYILAPMVDQSELAWRILARRHGAQLCYTPMLHAKLFSEDSKYRKEFFTTCETDRPLIAQFCANDPEILLKAARLVEKECDAVDINLGCPQDIARRGHYGSYLQDEWNLIFRMISTLKTNLSIPVTVKIRIFPDLEKTIKYAQMIESAGASILTVHGRIREQRGHNTGLADWNQIMHVKRSINIPLFANGNILYHEDIDTCLKHTGADGVMSAEGHLYNPCLFTQGQYRISLLVNEYLDICTQIDTPITCIRGHLFKMYKQCLSREPDLRDMLAKASSLDQFKSIANEWNTRLQRDEQQPSSNTNFPHWILQPYIRASIN